LQDLRFTTTPGHKKILLFYTFKKGHKSLVIHTFIKEEDLKRRPKNYWVQEPNIFGRKLRNPLLVEGFIYPEDQGNNWHWSQGLVLFKNPWRLNLNYWLCIPGLEKFPIWEIWVGKKGQGLKRASGGALQTDWQKGVTLKKGFFLYSKFTGLEGNNSWFPKKGPFKGLRGHYPGGPTRQLFPY